jgi:hypothetical protein
VQPNRYRVGKADPAKGYEPAWRQKVKGEAMTRLSVSILGSFRQYYPQVINAIIEFEKNGIVVKSPIVSKIINPGAPFVRFESDSAHLSDYDIQEITFDKIFASDFIYVVAPAGYIGRTTCYELGRVRERGIPVYFSEPVQDLPVEIHPEAVIGAADLAEMMMISHGQKENH